MWARIFIFSLVFKTLGSQVVSLDLCADQWALSLLDKKDIYAVTFLAQDPTLSYFAPKAQGLKTHGGSSEEFLSPKIKTVIAYEPLSPLLKKFFKKRKVTLLLLQHPTSFAELQKQTLFLTNFFNKQSLGHKWLQFLNAPKSPLKNTAAFYGAQGLCPGQNTLLNEVLIKAGYKNFYDFKKGWTYNSLESLLTAPLCRLFLMDPLPIHPFWKHLEKKTPLHSIPSSLTLCPHPAIVHTLIQHLRAFHV